MSAFAVSTNLGWPDDEIERLLGIRPRALDGVVRACGHLLNERHSAQIDGATNLLTKAVRARRAGDEPKATTFIERACAMPYDEREEVWPGPYAAHLLLFGAVLDVLESSAEDDERWLTAALEAVAEADERERAALVRVLTIVAA